MVLEFYNREQLSSIITVDYKSNSVSVENFTDDYLDRAFGIVEKPTMDDFEYFIEDRCFPKTRDHLKEILNELGLDYYDPIQIIRKTQGRMAEDKKWIKIIDE